MGLGGLEFVWRGISSDLGCGRFGLWKVEVKDVGISRIRVEGLGAIGWVPQSHPKPPNATRRVAHPNTQFQFPKP